MINKFKGRFGFLSNFCPVKIEHQGIKYPSVEHFYVAMKVNDQQLIKGVYYTPGDFREMIALEPDAAKVKKIGRLIKIRSNWDDQKLKIMNWGVREKFKDRALREMLLDTGDEILEEGNLWHDIYWGVCYCDKCYSVGENNLGKILMEVRNELRLK